MDKNNILYGWEDLNPEILKDKKSLIQSYCRYMLNRTSQMFEYEGLPDTITRKDLERILQTKGFAVIVNVTDKGDKSGLYAMYGGLGGVGNAYLLPTQTTLANPYLQYNATLEIDKDCVVMLNDSMYIGLMPMFSKYSALLAESDISIRFALINARVQSLVSASSDKVKKDAESFFKKVEEGKELGIIGGSSFFGNVDTKGYSVGSNTNIKDLMELQQYIRSQWYIDLGLDSNYNMKRESLNDDEIGMNDDILIPLIDDMLNERKIGVEKINKMFGTNISVKLASAWDTIRKEQDQVDEEQTEEGDDDETEREDS